MCSFVTSNTLTKQRRDGIYLWLAADKQCPSLFNLLLIYVRERQVEEKALSQRFHLSFGFLKKLIETLRIAPCLEILRDLTTVYRFPSSEYPISKNIFIFLAPF